MKSAISNFRILLDFTLNWATENKLYQTMILWFKRVLLKQKQHKVHILWEVHKNWKKISHPFWNYLVTSRQSGRFFQTFVAFSEYLKEGYKIFSDSFFILNLLVNIFHYSPSLLECSNIRGLLSSDSEIKMTRRNIQQIWGILWPLVPLFSSIYGLTASVVT
jgi:hypothetical protein